MGTDIGSGSDTGVSISVPRMRECAVSKMLDANAAASVAMALGHTLRTQILCRVVPFGERGLSAGTLSTQLMVVPSSLSFHLQQMTRAGILTARHEGRSVFYSTNHDGIAVLRDLLSRLIDQGNTPAAFCE